LVGQERIKDALKHAFDRNALGHAYLFSGDAGTGKFQAAAELSMALLCDSEDAVPCGECDSCRQVQHYAHPDFHCVMPLELQKEHKGTGGKLSDEGWAYLNKTCRDRIAEPYRLSQGTGISTIPVEWIREVNHSILRGSVSGRRNVAIICGIDMMNRESANAMLKTLEEPPAETVILLCTERPHAVLPTILSRCQILRFGHIPPDAMSEALAKTFSTTLDSPQVVSAVQCADGSLGRARLLLETPPDEYVDAALVILKASAEGNWEILTEALDGPMSDLDYGACERIFGYVIHLVRERLLHRYTDTENYFSSVSREAGLPEISTTAAERVVTSCREAARAVRARGLVPLVLVTLVMSIMEILDVEEYKAG
jgi:DNA polymerase-3 subunit delta'